MDFINSRLRKGMEWINQKSNKLNVSSIPFELHLPGYQFCGPGTKYNDRVKSGQRGINALDSACMDHDAVYNTAQEKNDVNRKLRANADDILIGAAKNFRNDPGISIVDKLSSYATEGAIRAKKTFGIF